MLFLRGWAEISSQGSCPLLSRPERSRAEQEILTKDLAAALGGGVAFVAAAVSLWPWWMVEKQVSLPAGWVGILQRWLSRCLCPQHTGSGSAAAFTPRFVSHQGDRCCL